MTETTSEINPEVNSKPTRKSQKSSGYISMLVILMIVAGLIGGILGFTFGRKSLEGVNPVPLGGRNLKIVPKPNTSSPSSALPKSYLLSLNTVNK
jgi:hypothetical protein